MNMIVEFIDKAKEFFKNEKYSECIDCCDMILGLNQNNIDVFIIKIKVFIKVGFYKEALNEVKIIETLRIEDSRIASLRIDILIGMGKINEVMNLMTPDMKLEEVKNIFEKLLSEEKFEELIVCCDKSINEGVIDSEFYLYKIKALFFLDRTSEALKVIGKALNSNLPNREGYLYCKGRIFVKLNKITEAIKEYGKAIECNNKYPYPYKELSNIYNMLGKYKEALKFAVKAMELEPKNEKNYITLMKIYYNLHYYNECIKNCKEFIELFNEGLFSEFVHMIYSSCYYKIGKINEAKVESEKCSMEYKNINDWLDLNGILS